MYKLCYKLWLDKDGKVFGQGPYKILLGIQATGSLAQAARMLNMSYSQAHTMIKNLSKKLGFPLVYSKTGGASGGETRLTQESLELLEIYGCFYNECEELIEDAFRRHFVANRDEHGIRNLATAFNIGEQATVAFVGGGGKTTLMFNLAHLLANKGKRVLVCTTTHIWYPRENDAEYILITDNLNEALETVNSKLKQKEILVLGTSIDEGKITGINQDWLPRLALGVDYILVEADGSRGKPLKAPAEHEPVIPAGTDVVIPVVGMDIFGKTLDNNFCHRPEKIAKIVGAKIGDIITPEIVVKLLASKKGGRKNVPANAAWIPCFNKMDTREQEEAIDAMGAYFLANGIKKVVGTTKRTPQMVIKIWEI